MIQDMKQKKKDVIKKRDENLKHLFQSENDE